MFCIQLNCLAKPFNNAERAPGRRHGRQPGPVRQGDRRGRAAGEHRPLHARVALLLHRPRYPEYNPTQAAKLVKAAEKTIGEPVTFTFGTTNSPAAIRAQEYLQQAWQDVGFKVKNTIVQQNDVINNALAGKYQALAWRQFGAVDPDLNYIFWSTTTVSSGVPVHQHGPQRRPEDRGRPAGRAGRAPTPDVREAAYKTVNKRLAVDLPYLWTGPGRLGRHRRPRRAELQQPDHAAGPAAFGMIGGSIWPTQIWIS